METFSFPRSRVFTPRVAHLASLGSPQLEVYDPVVVHTESRILAIVGAYKANSYPLVDVSVDAEYGFDETSVCWSGLEYITVGNNIRLIEKQFNRKLKQPKYTGTLETALSHWISRFTLRTIPVKGGIIELPLPHEYYLAKPPIPIQDQSGNYDYQEDMLLEVVKNMYMKEELNYTKNTNEDHKKQNQTWNVNEYLYIDKYTNLNKLQPNVCLQPTMLLLPYLLKHGLHTADLAYDTLPLPQILYGMARGKGVIAPHLLPEDPRFVDFVAQPDESPPFWVDWTAVRRGQAAYSLHGGHLFMSLAIVLLFGFAERRLADILVLSGEGLDRGRAFRRYYFTNQHVMEWLSTDLDDPTSTARNSIRQVRCLHAHARNKATNYYTSEAKKEALFRTRAELQVLRTQKVFLTVEEEKVWEETRYIELLELIRNEIGTPLSQFDMGLVLLTFAHTSCVLLQKVLGVALTTQEQHDICHLWRLIGFLLGIEDQFNICCSYDTLVQCSDEIAAMIALVSGETSALVPLQNMEETIAYPVCSLPRTATTLARTTSAAFGDSIGGVKGFNGMFSWKAQLQGVVSSKYLAIEDLEHFQHWNSSPKLPIQNNIFLIQDNYTRMQLGVDFVMDSVRVQRSLYIYICQETVIEPGSSPLVFLSKELKQQKPLERFRMVRQQPRLGAFLKLECIPAEVWELWEVQCKAGVCPVFPYTNSVPGHGTITMTVKSLMIELCDILQAWWMFHPLASNKTQYADTLYIKELYTQAWDILCGEFIFPDAQTLDRLKSSVRTNTSTSDQEDLKKCPITGTVSTSGQCPFAFGRRNPPPVTPSQTPSPSDTEASYPGLMSPTMLLASSDDEPRPILSPNQSEILDFSTSSITSTDITPIRVDPPTQVSIHTYHTILALSSHASPFLLTKLSSTVPTTPALAQYETNLYNSGLRDSTHMRDYDTQTTEVRTCILTANVCAHPLFSPMQSMHTLDHRLFGKQRTFIPVELPTKCPVTPTWRLLKRVYAKSRYPGKQTYLAWPLNLPRLYTHNVSRDALDENLDIQLYTPLKTPQSEMLLPNSIHFGKYLYNRMLSRSQKTKMNLSFMFRVRNRKAAEESLVFFATLMKYGRTALAYLQSCIEAVLYTSHIVQRSLQSKKKVYTAPLVPLEQKETNLDSLHNNILGTVRPYLEHQVMEIGQSEETMKLAVLRFLSRHLYSPADIAYSVSIEQSILQPQICFHPLSNNMQHVCHVINTLYEESNKKIEDQQRIIHCIQEIYVYLTQYMKTQDIATYDQHVLILPIPWPSVHDILLKGVAVFHTFEKYLYKLRSSLSQLSTRTWVSYFFGKRISMHTMTYIPVGKPMNIDEKMAFLLHEKYTPYNTEFTTTIPVQGKYSSLLHIAEATKMNTSIRLFSPMLHNTKNVIPNVLLYDEFYNMDNFINRYALLYSHTNSNTNTKYAKTTDMPYFPMEGHDWETKRDKAMQYVQEHFPTSQNMHPIVNIYSKPSNRKESALFIQDLNRGGIDMNDWSLYKYIN